eukprot:5086094-Amphidinium_carterae.1
MAAERNSEYNKQNMNCNSNMVGGPPCLTVSTTSSMRRKTSDGIYMLTLPKNQQSKRSTRTVPKKQQSRHNFRSYYNMQDVVRRGKHLHELGGLQGTRY